MSARARSVAGDPGSCPRYELRALRRGASDYLLEVWQVPSPATPHLRAPRRVAGLSGRNLGLVEPRVLRQLKQERIALPELNPGQPQTWELTEKTALHLGLLFRLLAPMRHRGHMRACAEGIEAMPREEAAYWLGMAMHRRYPRRVLMALRFLLIDPKEKQ